MSIIGTRPPLISETNFYELHHRARLAIKPGITGMWQVSGRSDITDFEEVVRLDKEYITNWNIGLDIKILLKNFRIMVLGRRGFYKTMPDDIYLKRVFKSSTGRTLDLENPKTYNEKLRQDVLCILTHESMLHPVAFSLKDQQVTMMNQSVNHGGSHLIVSEYSSPFGKFQIGCQYQAFTFITV